MPAPTGDHDVSTMIPRTAYREVKAERDELQRELDGIFEAAQHSNTALYSAVRHSMKRLASSRNEAP